MLKYLHVLTVVLLGLKLTGWTSISWWLVFSPSIFVIALGLIIIAALFLIAWMSS